MRKLLSPILLLGLLSACGGHDNNSSPLPTTPPVATNPTPTTADVFEVQVASVVATQSDTTDTPPVDDVTPTMPENTEPEPVQ